MTSPKPTIPDVVSDFTDYREKPGNGAWGSLHIVLDDGNVTDDDVRFCIDWAEHNGDSDGKRLGEVLLRMSKTQRKKLPWAVCRSLSHGG